MRSAAVAVTLLGLLLPWAMGACWSDGDGAPDGAVDTLGDADVATGDGGAGDAGTDAVDGGGGSDGGDDGGSGDGNRCSVEPAPGLQPPDQIIFDAEIEGETETFTFDVNGDAIYVNGESQLKISAAGESGDGEAPKLEINVLPIEPGTLGHWEDGDDSEVGANLCYQDGSGVQQSPNCTVGFSHSSSAYEVTLDEYDPDGRVVGTFSGTLEALPPGERDGEIDAPQTVEILDGCFDVKHK